MACGNRALRSSFAKEKTLLKLSLGLKVVTDLALLIGWVSMGWSVRVSKYWVCLVARYIWVKLFQRFHSLGFRIGTGGSGPPT